MSNLELLNLWAKSSPFKRLEQHLRETALVAEILLTKSAFAANLNRLCESLNVDSDETVRLTKYLAYLHDIGKAHPLFQCNECCNEAYIFFQAHPEYRYPVNISGYRHEIGSADIMRKVWGNSGKYDRATSQTFSSILAIHHQGRSQSSIGLFDEDDEWEYASEWVGLQESIAEDAEKLFSPPEISVKRMKHVDSACMVITAFIIMADWIASGDYLCISSEANSDEDIQGAVLHFLKDAALDGSLRTLPIAFTDLWPQIPRDSLRPVQAELEQFLSSGERMPLALIIEAPMGEGKTEAGICGAVKMGNYWGKNGLYIALPTAATANQMVDRVNVLLESHGISKARLIHSTAWLRQEVDFHLEDVQTLSAAEKWMMPNKRGLLAQYAVGTIDQSLMAALRIKYGVLRLLGLSSKVLIIDEVHAYDAYMSDILLKLLAWCRALYIPVVLLSATLPSEKRRQLLEIYGEPTGSENSYPRISAAYSNGTIETVDISGAYQHGTIDIHILPIADKLEQIADAVVDKVRNGGCICVIVNTVDKAQKVYRAIKGRTDAHLLLFHSRFTVGRRQEIEQECIRLFGPEHSNRPSKAVLVATQVVEQSLDIDFDAMFTEIAPVDLVLQRSGRLHRHRETHRPLSLAEPQLMIMTPSGEDYGPTELIYYKLLLDRTRKALKDRAQIAIPGDIPELVENVYSQEMDQQEIEAYIARMTDQQLQEGEAGQLELKYPDEHTFGFRGTQQNFWDDDEDSWVSAKTRLGEESVRLAIIPPELYERVKKSIDGNTAAKVMPFTATIAKKRAKELLDTADKTDWIIGSGKLNGTYILKAENMAVQSTDDLQAHIGGRTICFGKELGVIIGGDA